MLRTYYNFYLNSYGKILPKVLLCAMALLLLTPDVTAKLNAERTLNADGVLQQTKTVTGIVLDANGEPLIGSTIRQQGTNLGTAADSKGAFYLQVKGDAPVLEISYLGYVTQYIKVSNRSYLKVILREDAQAVDEVVVVGYGKSSVKRLTSAISTVKGDGLINMPNTNLISSLEGRTSGVFIESKGGEPGALPTISIRGGGEPLYVIDGIPSSKQEFSVLSPNDIESFTILKDAAATAVYGARAGNGIVMVTTKKGKNEKITISYNGGYAMSSPTESIQFLDNWQVAEAKDRAALYRGNKPSYMTLDMNNQLYWQPERLDSLKRGVLNSTTGNTDWNDLLFHSSAPSQTHNLSLSGGSKDTHYYMSARYYSLGGIYKTNISKNERYNLRMHVDHYFDNIGLRIDGDISFSQNDIKYPPHGLYSIWTHVARLNSLGRAFNTAGNPTGGPENPYVEIDPAAGYRKTTARYSNYNLSATWEVPKIKGFTVGALLRYNLYDNYGKDWFANNSGVGPVWNELNEPWDLGKAHLSEKIDRSNEITFEVRGDYNRTFKEAHTVGVTVLYNAYKYGSNKLGASRKEYATNVIEQINGGPVSTAENSGTASESGRAGIVGRLKYDYKMRYMIEASFRYDGSDKFPKGKRWGFFPSISAGWNIDKEPFMQSIIEKDYLTGLKFRFSWGKTGLDNVDAFQYLSVYSGGHDFYEGDKWNSTLKGGNLVSQDLSWYSQNAINYGVDADFFSNRLMVGFDYYYYRTTGYLGNPQDQYTTPLGTNLPKIRTNSAFRRAGFDLNLNWSDKIGRDFRYSIGLNFSNYDELWEKKYDEIESDLKNPLRRLTHQKSYYDLTYVSNGIYQNMDEVLHGARPTASSLLRPGDISYQDINGDGVIDSNDQIRQGSPRSPHTTYGIPLSASYKGIGLDLLFQGTGERSMMLESFNRVFNSDQIGLVGTNQFWYPGNTGEVLYPRYTDNANENGGNNNLNSTYWLLDANYFRLKNIKLSYDLKYKLLAKLSAISQFEVYVSGSNLLTFSPTRKYHLDPETGRNDDAMGTVGYPVQKIIQFGINLTF